MTHGINKNAIIMPPADKAPLHTGNIFVWMWYFLTPYRAIILSFFAYRTIRYGFVSLYPVVIGYVMNGLESREAFSNPQHYLIFLIVYGVLYGVFLINIIFQAEIAAYEKSMRAMTLFSIRHLNRLSLTWHEKQGSGGKLQRVMTGRRGFQELARHLRWDIFPLVGMFVAIGFTVYFMEIPLGYLPLYGGFIISYLLASWYFARPFLKLYDDFHHKFENLLSGVYEFVSAVRTVKAFDLGDHIYQKAEGLEEIGQDAIMRTFWANLVRWTFCNFIAAGFLLAFAVLGFLDVIDGKISAGAFAALFFLAFNLWHCADLIASVQEKLYEHGNAVMRLVETLRVKPKNLDYLPAEKIPDQWQTITFDNISYLYAGDADQGVRDISFTIRRGEKIAFVGASGAGKSTLVKILMKQILPDSGQLKIDTTPVSHIPTKDWLSQIGFVPQDVELFNLSIRDNILIDRDDVDEAFVNEILKQSALDDFIKTLPQGLETVIGERGVKLSGGQRQRLGIARALIRNAPIMIFDEVTSSLDSVSEATIQTAIENSFAGRTVFVIAHRLSTIRSVDRIIVLDQGRMIEDGTFQSLIEKGGTFAKLWSMQTEDRL